MGRILAIDYGQKRVGLAVTDPLKLIASSLKTVHSKDIIEFLIDYLKKEKVETIVVGVPKQMNGKPSESVKFIIPFINKLKKEFPCILIEEADERFTSKMAKQTLIESGVKRKKRRNKTLLDSISATIILQSYLERIK